eukprot:849406-Prymnesium_polylepis.1
MRVHVSRPQRCGNEERPFNAGKGPPRPGASMDTPAHHLSTCACARTADHNQARRHKGDRAAVKKPDPPKNYTEEITIQADGTKIIKQIAVKKPDPPKYTEEITIQADGTKIIKQIPKKEPPKEPPKYTEEITIQLDGTKIIKQVAKAPPKPAPPKPAFTEVVTIRLDGTKVIEQAREPRRVVGASACSFTLVPAPRPPSLCVARLAAQ